MRQVTYDLTLTFEQAVHPSKAANGCFITAGDLVKPQLELLKLSKEVKANEWHAYADNEMLVKKD